MENISNCPVCGSAKLSPYMTCTDFTVSKEQFQIKSCVECSFKFTSPRPTEMEIGRYYKSEDYISHTNTSKGLINSLYQIARKFTLKGKLDLISRLSKEKTLLDYGCGTGNFLGIAKSKGWNVLGLEPDEEARRLAAEMHGISVEAPDKLSSIPARSIPVITLWHVLEHIHKLNETLSEFNRILSEKGYLVIAVPNPASTDQGLYKEGWAAYDVPRHLYHFTIKDIDSLAIKHGLELVKVRPMLLDALYVSMLSEKYKGQSPLKGLLKGVLADLKAALRGKKEYSSLIYILRKK